MEHVRDRQLNCIVGAPGHGKSTLGAKLIRSSRDRDAIIYKEALDIDDPAYLEFKEVKFKEYRGGKVRINSMDIGYENLLSDIEKYFRNGTLLIDEGRLHEQNELSEPMARLAALRRKLGIDIYILYHGLTQVPIRSFAYINNIILFNTADSFKYKATRLPEMEQLLRAKEAIKKEVLAGNKYANRVIQIT